MTRTLYLGTDPSRYGKEVTHCPLIEVKQREVTEEVWSDWPLFTHVLISSRNALSFLPFPLKDKVVLAVGAATAALARGALIAPFAQQEGMVKALKLMHLEGAYVAIVGSSGARGIILDFLARRGIRHQSIILYDVVEKEGELPPLEAFDEIVFTSPSTVDAFFKKGRITTQKVVAIGRVTKERLRVVGGLSYHVELFLKEVGYDSRI